MTVIQYDHKQPCGCVLCETTRKEAYAGPGLYKTIRARKGDAGTTTWTLHLFVWGERLKPDTLVWVEREVERDEPGHHLKGVVIWVLDGDLDRFARRSVLCTSAMWLEPA